MCPGDMKIRCGLSQTFGKIVIAWTDDNLLSIGPLGAKVDDIWIKIQYT